MAQRRATRRDFLLPPMSSRTVALTLCGVLILAGVLGWLMAGATGPIVTVYRGAGCECCARWAQHLRAAGFRVMLRDDELLTDVRIAPRCS